MKNYVTCSLVDSCIYTMSCKGRTNYEDKFKEFVDFLSKVPREPNKYMQGGLKFEDEVEKLCNLSGVEYQTAAMKANSLVRKCANILHGASFQQNLNKDFAFEHKGLGDAKVLKIAGRWDAANADVIYDMKYCFRECFSGDFADHAQHLFYLYCTDKTKFIYLLCHENKEINYSVINEEVHLKTEDLEDQIKEKLNTFFDFLVENNIDNIYRDKWIWKGN